LDGIKLKPGRMEWKNDRELIIPSVTPKKKSKVKLPGYDRSGQRFISNRADISRS
jgi:hypothetical protein